MRIRRVLRGRLFLVDLVRLVRLLQRLPRRRTETLSQQREGLSNIPADTLAIYLGHLTDDYRTLRSGAKNYIFIDDGLDEIEGCQLSD